MKIYLISPYSDGSPMVRHARFEAAAKAAAELLKLGHLVYSPIAHCHPIAVAGDLPTDSGYWLTMNKSFMDWADIGVVLGIYGVDRSAGVLLDKEYLDRIGKEVKPYESIARGKEDGRA